jgi:PAS domain S-box-containing protein
MLPPPPPRWPGQVARALGLYALLGGIVSFLAWPLDMQRLADWDGDGLTIQPNAALCAILGGLAVLAYRAGRRGSGVTASVVLTAIGGVTLFEWLSGVATVLDSLFLFGREWGRLGILVPGRMGPPASFAFTALGAVLLMVGLGSGQVRRQAARLALLVLALSVLSLTGNLYDADVLYRIPSLSVIAMQTTSFITAVSIAVLVLLPERAPMRWLLHTGSVGFVARRAIPVVIVAPIVLGALQLRGEELALYENSFGTALLVLSLIALLGLLLWHGLSTLARQEDALRGAEERMRLAIDAGDAATWDLDLRTGRNVWSESHYRLLGYDPLATHDDPTDLWRNSVLPEDLPAALAEWQRAEAAHDLYRVDHRMRRTDGRIVWVRTAGRFFYDDRGRAQRFVGVWFDVTEARQAITALLEADRRKDEFLAMLAHELRNPLAPVRNALAILRLKGGETPELQWAREVIDRQVVQMTRLIDDLLDVSRITTGKIELRREPVPLANIVAGAVEASRPLIDQAGHELSIDLPPEPVWLHADLVRLAQVFCNLLNNAARYTPRGGHIWLRAEVHEGRVAVSVRDDGVGIPADMLARIFDLFTQVKQGRDHPHGGLGIGLTLVKRLVELHGGSVEARSTGAGLGAEFVVRLPVAEDQRAPARRTAGATANAGSDTLTS